MYLKCAIFAMYIALNQQTYGGTFLNIIAFNRPYSGHIYMVLWHLL